MRGDGGNTILSILHGRFPALRSRDFRLLWIGQTISVAGGQMQFWALNWHIYALTHSPIALGLIGLFRVVPIVLFSLAGGVVADAHDRKKVYFFTQIVLASIAAALCGLTWAHHMTAAGIYALTAVAASALAFANPARQSLVPTLVPREHFPNAAALTSISHQVSTIVGPVAAGFLIARGSLAATYGVNALSFIATLIALLLIHSPQTDKTEESRGEMSVSAMMEGLRFVRQTPILVSTIILDFFATFWSSANALLPVFARDVLHVGARGYGLLAASAAVGSLGAGAAVALLPSIKRQGSVLLWSVVWYGAATVAFGWSKWFWLSWLALAVTGAADTVSTILRQTIRQLITPDRLRGRMTAANMIFFMGGPQLGELEAGLAAAWIGAPGSVILGGVACLISTAWLTARFPLLRHYVSND